MPARRSNGLLTSDSIFNTSADSLEQKIGRVLDIVLSMNDRINARFDAMEAKIDALKLDREIENGPGPGRSSNIIQSPNGVGETNDGWCLSESSEELRKSIRPMKLVVSPPSHNVEVQAASSLTRRRGSTSRRSPRKRRRVSPESFFGDENSNMNDNDGVDDNDEEDDSEVQIITEIARPLSPDDMDDEEQESVDEGTVSRATSPYRYGNSVLPPIVETPTQGTTSQVYSCNIQNITNEELEATLREADDMKATFFDLKCTSSPFTVLKIYKEMADKYNYPTAILRVCEMYLKGAISLDPKCRRVVKNMNLAGKYVRKLLEHEDVKNAEEDDEYWGIKSRALAYQGEYYMARGNKKDKQLALTSFKTSAEMRDEYGQYKVGFYYMDMFRHAISDRTEKQYLADSMANLEKAVDMGSGDAAALLGSIYENIGELDAYVKAINEHNKRTLTKDEQEAKAKELFLLSMDLGCSGGTNDAAACFEVGYAGIEPNFYMALNYYKTAFSLGWITSASNIALLYQVGGTYERFKDKINVEEALRWLDIGHRLRCPLSTNQLGAAYDSGGIAELDRKKAVEFYEMALKYGHESNDFNDIIENTKESLCRLLCTSILIEEMNAAEAKKKMKKFTKEMGLGRLEKARTSAMWIVCATLNAGKYGHCQSAEKAPTVLLEALGDENCKVIQQYVMALCTDFRNGRHMDENRRKLRALVDDRNIQVDLDLIEAQPVQK